MEPDGDVARCASCGSTEIARRQPLLVVVAASGAGKSTIAPLVADRLRGECVVFDVDWLLDPIGHDWPLLRDVWLHVAHGVAQIGLPTLLLGPFIPEHLEDLGGRRWIGEIHHLVFDCTDDERRRRIDARPPWRAHDSDAQVAFGQWLRANIEAHVDTTNASEIDTADAVARWARSIITPPGG